MKKKNHKKVFFRYVNNKQKQKENTGLLLTRRGESITNNTEKEEVLSAFFTSVFTSTVGVHALGTKIQVDANTNLPSVKKELACQLSQELDPYKWMDPDNNHPRIRELVDTSTRLFSHGDQGASQKTGRRLMSPSSTRRAYRRIQEITRSGPISLTSVPGKVMKEIIMEVITSQMKRDWEKPAWIHREQVILDKPDHLQ